jgi:hypothetical protein
MEKKLEISCSVDLYRDDVKAGKWYEVYDKWSETLFWFLDDNGFPILANTEDCAHLKAIGLEDAYWTVREIN